ERDQPTSDPIPFHPTPHCFRQRSEATPATARGPPSLAVFGPAVDALPAAAGHRRSLVAGHRRFGARELVRRCTIRGRRHRGWLTTSRSFAVPTPAGVPPAAAGV